MLSTPPDKLVPAFSAADGNSPPAFGHPELLFTVGAFIDTIFFALSEFLFLFPEKALDLHLPAQVPLILRRSPCRIVGKHAKIRINHQSHGPQVKKAPEYHRKYQKHHRTYHQKLIQSVIAIAPPHKALKFLSHTVSAFPVRTPPSRSMTHFLLIFTAGWTRGVLCA